MTPQRVRALVVCASICIAVLAAPRTCHARLHPGVELGLDYSTFRYTKPLPIWDVGWSPSVSGGFTLEIPVHDPISILTGVRFVRLGERVRYETGPGPVREYGTFRQTQDYISVPLLMQHRFMHTGRLAFCFGPEVGYVIGARSKLDATDDDGVTLTPRTADQDLLGDLNRFDLALDGSAGYDFPVGRRVLSTTLRYRHSMNSPDKDDHWATDWRPHALEALLGLHW